MYSGFGLYISAVGIALVFTSLLAIWLLIVVTKRLFHEGEEPPERDGKLARVAAVAAALTFSDGERRAHIPKAEGAGHWRAAAKIEALDRGMKQER